MSDTFGITPEGWLRVGDSVYEGSKTFSKDTTDPLGDFSIRRGRIMLGNGWVINVLWGTMAKCENFCKAGAELNEAPTTCEVAVFDGSTKGAALFLDERQILQNATTQQVNELVVLGKLN